MATFLSGIYPESIRNLSGKWLVLDAAGGGEAPRALLSDSCKESRSPAGWRRGSESVFDQQLQGKSISGKRRGSESVFDRRLQARKVDGRTVDGEAPIESVLTDYWQESRTPPRCQRCSESVFDRNILDLRRAAKLDLRS